MDDDKKNVCGKCYVVDVMMMMKNNNNTNKKYSYSSLRIINYHESALINNYAKKRIAVELLV